MPSRLSPCAAIPIWHQVHLQPSQAHNHFRLRLQWLLSNMCPIPTFPDPTHPSTQCHTISQKFPRRSDYYTWSEFTFDEMRSMTQQNSYGHWLPPRQGSSTLWTQNPINASSRTIFTKEHKPLQNHSVANALATQPSTNSKKRTTLVR